MIFKRFFKPKWQHADAAVRQQAIQELNRDEQAHKSVLHELAFNDGAEAVRKAALLKLNDFSLWWQASKHDSAERLQQLAEQTVIQQLLNNQVEPKLKQQFIAQCNRSTILEQLAQTETDAGIKFGLLQRLNKPELNVKALQEPLLALAQKRELLSQVTDEKTLEKLAKQCEGELLADVQHKLQQLHEQKQKPLQLRKQLTLLLAKLNALRERSALADLPAQLAQYQQQWQAVLPELDCLGAEADEYRSKYEKICLQIEQWLAPRLVEFNRQQAELRVEAERQQLQQQLSAKLDAIQQLLHQALQTTDINAAQQLEQQLNALANELQAADISAKAPLQQRLATMQQQLNQLPLLAEQLAQLTRIVADWAAVPVPQTAEVYQALTGQLKQYQQDWQRLTKAIPIAIPADLQQAKLALAQQWQQLAADFNAQTDKYQRQCRSKLAQYRRLYSAGKYKVLFGLFKGIEQDYAQLTAQQQAQLNKDYEFARDKQLELADWQGYIATPRKQQLVEQIQQLPLDITPSQIRQRADEVKRARATWNSLGKAEPTLEPQLNAAFDQACEQAFAPCRVYFAEQDALRAGHVVQRQQLIAQLQELAQQQMDAKALEMQLQQLKQAWQQAGAVDKQQFVVLNEQFNLALTPLREQLAAAQQQVADAKQQLIAKAQAAVQLSEQNQTAKVLKECQQQWKQLGSAARKQDQQLWQQFRAVCDGFFNARSAQFEQQKQAEQAEVAQFESVLSAVIVELELAAEPSAFDAVQQQLNAMTPQSVATQQAVRQLLDKLKQKQQRWQQSQQQRDFNRMFELLRDASVSADQLPAGYRECFAAQQEQQFTRQQLTVALELVCEAPSPDTEAPQRQQVQLMLLSDKHNQGRELDKHSLLKRWLQFGPLSPAELPLLARIQQLFN
ncbi:DUF349 domain-containing protein [Rheinheimera maricola]|uniref:DUF349 domain-containing protein n=1 Tax=Rheinheimera maricola TaxID=2793282 RepID=A0ABS7X783_9GAMM|nr:DUF349 domain-containing protein [Rheinheimera maricola]MBZ9611030.1 DUF349 domain-containing protein [Rheinheimera maricola]